MASQIRSAEQVRVLRADRRPTSPSTRGAGRADLASARTGPARRTGRASRAGSCGTGSRGTRARRPGRRPPGDRDQRRARHLVETVDGRVHRVVELLGEALEVGQDQVLLAREVPVEHVLAAARQRSRSRPSRPPGSRACRRACWRREDPVAGGGVGGAGHGAIIRTDRSDSPGVGNESTPPWLAP